MLININLHIIRIILIFFHKLGSHLHYFFTSRRQKDDVDVKRSGKRQKNQNRSACPGDFCGHVLKESDKKSLHAQACVFVTNVGKYGRETAGRKARVSFLHHAEPNRTASLPPNSRGRLSIIRNTPTDDLKTMPHGLKSHLLGDMFA